MASRRDRRRMKRANLGPNWFGEIAILTMVMITVSSGEVWNGLGEVRSISCGLGLPQQSSNLMIECPLTEQENKDLTSDMERHLLPWGSSKLRIEP
jgi:hypothetical protein